jgi:hypothetical protein
VPQASLGIVAGGLQRSPLVDAEVWRKRPCSGDQAWDAHLDFAEYVNDYSLTEIRERFEPDSATCSRAIRRVNRRAQDAKQVKSTTSTAVRISRLPMAASLSGAARRPGVISGAGYAAADTKGRKVRNAAT